MFADNLVPYRRGKVVTSLAFHIVEVGAHIIRREFRPIALGAVLLLSATEFRRSGVVSSRRHPDLGFPERTR